MPPCSLRATSNGSRWPREAVAEYAASRSRARKIPRFQQVRRAFCWYRRRAGERNRTADLPLTRSFHDPLSAAAFLMRAGLLIIWLHLNVSGLRLVLARGWHRLRLDANCWRA